MSSTPLAVTGGEVCWKRVTNSSWPRSREQRARRRGARRRAGRDRRAVGVLDAPRPRLDVGAVDRQRRQRVGDAVDRRAASRRRGDLAREGRRRLLELRARARPRRTASPCAAAGRVERRLARRVDEQRGGVVEELVADRALDRPVAQRPRRGAGSSRPRRARAPASRSRAQVAGRVGEPVGVVDAQPVDDAVARRARGPCRGRASKTSGSSTRTAGEVVDVEEAPVPAVGGVVVEDPRALALVGPPAVLVGDAHVVGHDVEDDPQALGGAARAGPPRRRARRTRGWVDDVVAVRRAGARLQRRRQVQVRDPEVAQVGHERARRRRSPARARAAAGRSRDHVRRRRSSFIDRAGTAHLAARGPALRAGLERRVEGAELVHPLARRSGAPAA